MDATILACCISEPFQRQVWTYVSALPASAYSGSLEITFGSLRVTKARLLRSYDSCLVFGSFQAVWLPQQCPHVYRIILNLTAVRIKRLRQTCRAQVRDLLRFVGRNMLCTFHKWCRGCLYHAISANSSFAAPATVAAATAAAAAQPLS